MGTYPPRQCGIATFTRDLREGLGHGSVVALDPLEDALRYPLEVISKIRTAVADDYHQAAELLDAKADVVSLQHEFGIFGGPDGEMVLDLLARAHFPVVTTLHTVRSQPTARQREVLSSIVEASARVVVMSQRAKEIASRTLAARTDRIEVIPHGVPDLPSRS